MSETIQSTIGRPPSHAHYCRESSASHRSWAIHRRPEGHARLKRAVSRPGLRRSAGRRWTPPQTPGPDGLADQLAASGRHVTRSGPQPDAQDSAEELIRTAETTGADFIVIGLRRRSPGRQAPAGQQCPASPTGCGMSGLSGEGRARRAYDAFLWRQSHPTRNRRWIGAFGDSCHNTPWSTY